MTKIAKNEHVFRCEQLNADFDISSIQGSIQNDFSIAVKPEDIRLIIGNDASNSNKNIFQVVAEKIVFKESDALVFLAVPETGFSLQMSIPSYTLKKSGIKIGEKICCKINEDYARVVY